MSDVSGIITRKFELIGPRIQKRANLTSVVIISDPSPDANQVKGHSSLHVPPGDGALESELHL